MHVVVKRHDNNTNKDVYWLYNYLNEEHVRELMSERTVQPTGNSNEHLYQIVVVDMEKIFEEAWQKQSRSVVPTRE